MFPFFSPASRIFLYRGYEFYCSNKTSCDVCNGYKMQLVSYCRKGRSEREFEKAWEIFTAACYSAIAYVYVCTVKPPVNNTLNSECEVSKQDKTPDRS